MAKNVTRLYKQFIPEHYDLQLVPDRDQMLLSGTVTMRGKKVGRPSRRLTFHQNGLKITKATVTRKDRKGTHEVVIDRINHQKSYDEVRLHAAELLYPGEYTVTLDFAGKITRPMNGVYPCFFKYDDQDKQLVATQFESHHAREAFPCIDEPEAKATFQLTLTTPADEAVISNTPVETEAKGTAPHTKQTTFAVTPKMSTYLLAFVYGDMGYKEATTKDGVVVRTYATPDNVQFTNFALDVAVKVLEFYNDYFGLAYPLPKCDMVALPDFASGAMENWGCITYREQCLFVDPQNTSLSTKQYVAMVVAHELAHQWFGNLVTMRWWTDLWLNEGFASWIEYMAVDHLFPEWQMWTQFVTDEQHPALRLDALENTHPIEVPVRHPDEIRTIFDTISYSKGASVIHMLHEYLGPVAFRDGLRHYLKAHEYSNTDTIDLWKSLEQVSKKPVKAFMHSWTAQPGYPIVRTTVSDAELTASQERFFTNPDQAPADRHTWPVPLKAPGTLADTLLEKKQGAWKLAKHTPALKLNTGQSGFYRTIYNPEHLQELGHRVAQGKLPPLDRLGILSDAFEAARAGYASSADALQLLRFYEDESNTVVWDVIAGGLGNIRSGMDDDELRELMKPFVRTLTAKQLKRLGWKAAKDEPYFDSLLRPTILGMASLAEDSSVIAEATKQFESMKKPEDLAPDLRGVIYNTNARNGDAAVFKKLLSLHNSTSSSEERTTLAAALTGFKQPKQVGQALDLIATDTVRLQDVSYWVAYSFMNRYAKDATWEWMTSHWEWLRDNIGSDLSFHRFPIYAARSYSDKAFLPKYQAFFQSVMTPALDRAYKQGLEMIESHAAWKSRDLQAVKAFFEAQL